VFKDMLLTVAIAGLVAALAMSFVQLVFISPLILQAEVYEDAAEANTSHEAEAALSGHHHDESDWKPENGLQRQLFTLGANLLMGFGYAFLLVAVYTLWRHPSSAGMGLVYGALGFLIFFAAPGLGLAPELPGTAAADLSARQMWWASTVVATAAGFALLFGTSRWWSRAAGVALLIAPHLAAAPHLAVERSLAPEELTSRFRWATTVCNAVFWLVLGWVSSITFRKLLLVRLAPRGQATTAG
jgi:cobalt transporter subunit CbtA